MNPGGYIGEATRREIAYANALGKPVTYFHELAMGGQLVGFSDPTGSTSGERTDLPMSGCS